MAEAVFVEDRPAEVDESEIFVFGRVSVGGAKLEGNGGSDDTSR